MTLKTYECFNGDIQVCRELVNPAYGQMVPADTHGRPQVTMAQFPIITDAYRIECTTGHFSMFTYDPFTDPTTTHFGG